MKTIFSKYKLYILLVSIGMVLISPIIIFSLSQSETDEIIRDIDDRQHNSGDYKALCYIQFSEEGHEDMLYESIVYRRDEDEAFLILFTAPREEEGKAYLSIDNNLWFYDPVAGHWERRTVRENIVGTGSRQPDLDDPTLSEDYNAIFVRDEMLGRFNVHQIELRARDNIDVAYPVVKLWVDAASNNILKAEDYALSGRLMRTRYYPNWIRVRSPSAGDYVYYPESIRIFDEVETGNSTVILIQDVDLRDLPDNVFTKGYVESQSR